MSKGTWRLCCGGGIRVRLQTYDDDNDDDDDGDDDDEGDGDGAMGSGVTGYDDDVVVVVGW